MKFKKTLKYITFLLMIIGLTFLYSFSVKRNAAKKIEKIVVEFEAGVNNFLTHEMVNKLLIQNDTTLKNQAKTVIDLYSLENNVLKNPYVENASVFLTIDGRLKSVIKQRQPVARILGAKEVYYIDKQGVKMPLSTNYSSRVLLVSGVNNDDEIIEILPLILKIEGDDFLHKEIVGILKSAENEYQFSARSGEYKIDFGNF